MRSDNDVLQTNSRSHELQSLVTSLPSDVDTESNEQGSFCWAHCMQRDTMLDINSARALCGYASDPAGRKFAWCVITTFCIVSFMAFFLILAGISLQNGVCTIGGASHNRMLDSLRFWNIDADDGASTAIDVAVVCERRWSMTTYVLVQFLFMLVCLATCVWMTNTFYVYGPDALNRTRATKIYTVAIHVAMVLSVYVSKFKYTEKDFGVTPCTTARNKFDLFLCEQVAINQNVVPLQITINTTAIHNARNQSRTNAHDSLLPKHTHSIGEASGGVGWQDDANDALSHVVDDTLCYALYTSTHKCGTWWAYWARVYGGDDVSFGDEHNSALRNKKNAMPYMCDETSFVLYTTLYGSQRVWADLILMYVVLMATLTFLRYMSSLMYECVQSENIF